jgi:hypothetical protein
MIPRKVGFGHPFVINSIVFEILNKIMVALFTSSLHMKCTDGESYINKRKYTLED